MTIKLARERLNQCRRILEKHSRGSVLVGGAVCRVYDFSLVLKAIRWIESVRDGLKEAKG